MFGDHPFDYMTPEEIARYTADPAKYFCPKDSPDIEINFKKLFAADPPPKKRCARRRRRYGDS